MIKIKYNYLQYTIGKKIGPMNNILISACAVAASKRRPARASDSDDGAEEDRSDTDSLRRVIDRMFEPHADVDYCDKAKEIYQWCIKTYYTHPDAKFTRDEIKKGCPLITPEIIEHGTRLHAQRLQFPYVMSMQHPKSWSRLGISFTATPRREQLTMFSTQIRYPRYPCVHL